MLIVIIFLLVDKYLTEAEDEEGVAYTLGLIAICGISASAIFCLVLNSLKEACFVKELTEWVIYSYDHIEQNQISLNNEAEASDSNPLNRDKYMI